jgi:preprotein translocase subunit YajC
MLSLAAAQAQPAGGRTGTVLMIYMVAFAFIMWFLIIRPQRKVQEKHRTMLGALKKGDEVMTEGGIIGQVVHLTDDRATLKSAENTRVVVARAKIARVMTPPAE